MSNEAALNAIAREMNERMRPHDHPQIGQTWICNGREVTISGGYYLDPIYGYISNFWNFKGGGGAYDNDRTIFYPK